MGPFDNLQDDSPPPRRRRGGLRWYHVRFWPVVLGLAGFFFIGHLLFSEEKLTPERRKALADERTTLLEHLAIVAAGHIQDSAEGLAVAQMQRARLKRLRDICRKLNDGEISEDWFRRAEDSLDEIERLYRLKAAGGR